MSEFKGTLASPIGLLRLEATHKGLTAVRFPHNVSVSAERTIHNPLVAEAKQQLSAYFDGKLDTFSVPLDWCGTAFQKSVWLALTKIRYGDTMTYADIARAIGRDPGTVSRELRRNAATRSGKQEYRAGVAQWKAQQAAKRPKTAKLVTNEQLREYVQDRLAGNVRGPDGTIVPGPTPPPWKGLNKPRRQDRRWSTAWSPEQIAQRLKVEFPDDESMRISHEAIYQSLFIEGRGALKRELVTCLRTGRALREPRARSQNKAQGHVTADVVLSERPAEADDRAVPGHWESQCCCQAA